MATANLDILVNAKNNASPTLKTVQADVKSISGMGTMVKGALTGLVAAGAVTAITEIGSAMVDLAVQAGNVEKVRASFDDLATGVGQSSTVMIASLRQASGGMITDADLMLAANKAMMLGVADTAEEMTGLLDVARVRGQAMGLSMTQAFDDIVTGLGRGSALILDNLGITIDLEETYKDYAATLGKTAAQLTAVEQKQALVNAVMAQAPASGGAIDNASSAIARMTVSIENAKVALGELFGPGVIAGAQAVSNFANAAADSLKDTGVAQTTDAWFKLTEQLAAAREQLESLKAQQQTAVIAPPDMSGPDMAIMQSNMALVQQADSVMSGSVSVTQEQVAASEELVMALEKQAKAAYDAMAAAKGLTVVTVQTKEEAEAAAAAVAHHANRWSAFVAVGSSASVEMTQLASKLGAIGQMALMTATDVAALNAEVKRLQGVAAAIAGVRTSAISQATSLAVTAVTQYGAAWEDVAPLLTQAELGIEGMILSSGESAQAMALNQIAVEGNLNPLQNLITGFEEADRAAAKMASGGVSSAQSAFDDLKSKVSSVLSGSTDLGFMGDTSDLFPREDAVNENARRLGAIAREGLIGQGWLEEFKSEVPDIYAALVDSGDPQSEAKRLLREFQQGMVPELIDKDKAKDLVKRMIVGEANAAALAEEIATELATELGMSKDSVLASAKSALGVSGGSKSDLSVAGSLTDGTTKELAGSEFGKQVGDAALSSLGSASGIAAWESAGASAWANFKRGYDNAMAEWIPPAGGGATSTPTTTGGAAAAGNSSISITINGVATDLHAVGGAARNGVLDALRARGQS